MSDLKAKLLVVADGADSAAIGVAEKLGVTIARLKPMPEQGAGQFRSSPSPGSAAKRRGHRRPGGGPTT